MERTIPWRAREERAAGPSVDAGPARRGLRRQPADDAHVTGTRELLHVLVGEVVGEVADQTLALQAGDALSFHGDVPHACADPGASPARSLSVFEPAVGTAHHERTARA